MVLRSTCLWQDEIIGIESIYTVGEYGEQIDKPDELNALREKSDKKKLFCPCGCGANLILVAPDKSTRARHFRIYSKSSRENCVMVFEGKTSMYSRITLKIWLEDKLKTDDIKSRVKINSIEDTDRKYEFSFLSLSKKIAVIYCRDRANLSDEKIKILDENRSGISLVYIVDGANVGTNGQYQEWLDKIQKRQGYCLFLYIDGINYDSAELKCAFYDKDMDNRWQEIPVCEGKLKEYSFDENGNLLLKNESVSDIKNKAKDQYDRMLEEKKLLKEKQEEERQREKELREELARQAKSEWEEKHRKAEKERQERIRIADENKKANEQKHRDFFFAHLDEHLNDHSTPVFDMDGNRWLKCRYCGKKSISKDFIEIYDDLRTVGRCRDCEGKADPIDESVSDEEFASRVCPECGGRLIKRKGKFGDFVGCSNYPECRYTRKVF